VAYSHDPGVRDHPDPDPRRPRLRQHQRGREHRDPGRLQPRRAARIPGGPPPKRRPRPAAVPRPGQPLHRRPDGGRAVPDPLPPAGHRKQEL
ncbi:MAG: hypothetical protein AVDCRST_MAG25-1351, partial [uncultured Rubrobacteraceae bacterium]